MKLVSFMTAAAVLSLSAGVAAAGKTTEQQKIAAVQNLALISTAKRWCDAYQIDVNSTVEAALQFVDITEEPYKARFRNERENAEKMAASAGTTAFCAAAYVIFGPDGMGLMIRK